MKIFPPALALLALASPFLAQDDLRFPQPFHLFGVQRDLAAGDLTGDGLPDLVRAVDLTNSSALELLPSAGDGTFGSPVSISLPFSFVAFRFLRLGDLDEDGDLDVVLASLPSPTSSGPGDGVYLLFGDGGGGFPTSVHLFDDVRVEGLELADLDGDGHLDLVTYDESDGDASDVELWYGDGTGAFTSSSAVLGGELDFLHTADLNGDGFLDLVGVSTAAGSEGVRVALSTGARAYGTGSGWPTASSVPRQVTSTDLDADGAPDLLVTTGQVGGLELLFNDGTGAFPTAGLAPLADSFEARTVEATDLDADGDEDVVVWARYGAPTTGFRQAEGVYVLRNDGSGVPTFLFRNRASDVYANGFDEDTRRFALADLDGSGTLDLAFRIAEKGVGLAFGGGDASFRTPEVLTTLEPSWQNSDPRFADIDADGDLDMVLWQGPVDRVLRVYWNAGAGAFTSSVDLTPVRVNSNDIQVADIDGDCLLDVLHLGLDEVLVWRNLGGQQFGPVEQYPYSALNYGPMAVGDWDGDGDRDLVCAALGSFDTNFARFLNDGGGVFGPPQVTLAVKVPSSLASGDFDGDGRDELVVGSLGGFEGSITLYDADAGGTFEATGTELFENGIDVQGLFATDLDADGRLDLVASQVGFVVRLLGNGDGTFRARTFAVSSGNTRLVTAGDVDGDGDLDLAVSDFANPRAFDPVTILENVGAGTFVEQAARYATGAGELAGLALLDLDEDGAVELLALPYEGDELLLHQPVAQPGDGTCQLDLGFGGPGTSRLSACGDALSAGGTTTLSLRGARPSSVAFLAVSTGITPRPLFGGCLAPDLQFVLTLATDANGAFDLPGIPGGRGPLSLNVQVAYLDPVLPGAVGFSNALRLDFLP